MEFDNHFWLSIFHLVLVVPLLLYIGYTRANTPQWLYTVAFIIGWIILVYHGFKLVVRLRQRSSIWWVNAIHVLFVAPLLLYIGYHKKDTPRMAYELLLMLAFSGLGYHAFNIVRMLQTHPE